VLIELAASFDGASVLARLVHHAAGAAQRDAVQSSAAAAARHASAMGAHAEAAAHYRTALAWAEGLEPSARAEILDLLAYECYIVGDMPAARDARIEALGLRRSLNQAAEIGRDLRWLSRLAWFLGDFDGARERALEALEAVLPLGDGEDLAWTLSNCAQLHMLAHEHEPCLAFGERAIAMARAIGAVDVLSHALNNVGTSRAVAGDPLGWPQLEESLTLALEHDLHEHAARAFTNLATVAVRDRDYEPRGNGSIAACNTPLSATWTRGGSTCSPRTRACRPKPADGVRPSPRRSPSSRARAPRPWPGYRR
jgi:tetratricopeptide (TPR) repeat protein